MQHKRAHKPKYEYQILINRKVVWHGINAKEKLAELTKKYPKVEIGIKWIPKQGVLIARAGFSVQSKPSGIFGNTKRPLIDLHLFSEIKKKWLFLSEVLADTGADISILPRTIGESLVRHVKRGKYLEIRGIAPGAYTEVFVHHVTCKIGDIKFKAPFAIADSDDIPPILGRCKGLDLFEAMFDRGKKTRLFSK